MVCEVDDDVGELSFEVIFAAVGVDEQCLDCLEGLLGLAEGVAELVAGVVPCGG